MSDAEVDPIRVLHVDDDREIVDLATTFLEREDDRLEIEPAESAGDALDRLADEEIHCIISDYQLPDMDCRSFVDAVTDERPGFPFILFTGRDRTQLDDDLFDAGVTGYLQKGSGTQQYADLAAAIADAVETDGSVRPDGGQLPSDEPTADGSGLAALAAENPETVLAGALDAIEDGFFVLDGDGELVHWNDFVTERTGYDDATIAGMAPRAMFAPEDRARIETAIERTWVEGSATVEAAVETADGEQFPVEFRASRLTDADGDPLGLVGIARDVSDRAAYERELERQNERLEELISAVSHDMRNPLNVVSGRVALARETGDDEHFDAIRRATDRIETLVEDLVELARQGNTVDDTDTVDLAAFAEETWADMETGDATLSVETASRVRADRGRLRQVFRNLFANALEHAGPGAAVTVGDADAGFYVADDGPGISADDRKRLWEYGESTGEEGTGLGLALVRRVAEAHGWTVGMATSSAGGIRVEFTDVDGSGPLGQ